MGAPLPACFAPGEPGADTLSVESGHRVTVFDEKLRIIVHGSATANFSLLDFDANFGSFTLYLDGDPDELFGRGTLVDLIAFANLVSFDSGGGALWVAARDVNRANGLSYFEARPPSRYVDLTAFVRLMEPKADFIFEMMPRSSTSRDTIFGLVDESARARLSWERAVDAARTPSFLQSPRTSGYPREHW